MPAAAFGQRTVIIGNSGSGKTMLARALGAHFGIASVDLDRIHWASWDGRGHKRDEESARTMTQAEAAGPRWIIEGVYGWLAEVALPRATSLIWLDLPWEDCRAGLLQRGPWPGVDEAGFAEFLSWAEACTSRRTSTSRAGHGRFFEAFAGPKTRLDSREGIGRLMAGLAEEKAE